MRPMVIPVLHGASSDRPDELDTLTTAGAICAALTRLGHASRLVHVGPDLAAMAEVERLRPDLVFNLVEALGGDAGRAVEAPDRLERRGIPFTGCTAAATRACMSKPAVKRKLAEACLPTPPWWHAGDEPAGVSRVIVKSALEHASVGIDALSVVPAAAAAAEIAAREGRFGGTFFAEAYIEGREFNISVIEGSEGPVVLPPAEIVFVGYADGRPRIVDYEAKWIEGSHGFEHTPRRFDFPATDRHLIERLSALSRDAWQLFGLTGYARVDFRVDGEGRPWILEVNTNPCLAPDAGFVAAAAEAGIGYDALVARIVESALVRHRKAA